MTKKTGLTLLLVLLTATAAQAQTWWGYWNSTMPATAACKAIDPVNTYALRLTAANTQLMGSQIHGVRFFISDKTAVRRAFVWVSRNTFNWDASSPDMGMKEIPLEQLRDMTHDAMPTEALFDQPVSVLPATSHYASAYVGFTLQLSDGSQPCYVMSAPGTAVSSNACFVQWRNQETSYGPLALQLLVSGERIQAQGVAPQPLPLPILAGGRQLTADVAFTSDGETPVESIDCQFTIGGQPQPEQHIVLQQPMTELGVTTALPVSLDLPTLAQVYDYALTVTRVNGLDNLSASPTATGQLTVLSQTPLKRSVMEEYTGTWCPNCPRGDVGLELLDEMFADRFIGISVHNDDPMTIKAYDSSPAKRRFADGYPSCAIDRLIACDPYTGFTTERWFQTDRIVAYALEQPTVADLDIVAEWSADGSRLDCTALTTFRYSADQAPYALAFVLTADSLTGDGSDWLQVNTFAGSTDWDEPMTPFTTGDRYMKMAYDHVAIDVAGIDQGLAGSIAAPITADETQRHTATFDIAANKLVQDRSRLNAIALLIDTVSGQVVNAVKTRVASPSGLSPISPTSRPDTPAYDLLGRPATGRTSIRIEKRAGHPAKSF